ncbi:MAG: hypothetical protein EXS64_12210 [Candidatus Latescibacteria bacterium]|nr:hypothetical protein [Candidatus Latescibacterota bacterium]
MSDARDQIRKALDEVRVIDPHCHLRLAKPSADSLADIVLYHHVWIELVSSGMDQFEVSASDLPHELADPEIAPLERVRRSLKHLPNTRNTTLGLFLRWILKDLYGVDRLTESNLETVFADVARKGQDPAWQERLLRERCGIDHNISVELRSAPYSGRMLKAREIFPANLIHGKQTSSGILSGWESAFGREIRTALDYTEFLRETVSGLSVAEYKFLGWWVVPCVTDALSDEDQITRTLQKVRHEEPLSHDEIGGFCYSGMRTLLQELRRTPLRTIQVIVGAEVLPPHRSLTHWNGNFCGAIGRIANQFEDFRFDLSTASDAYTQDLGILSRHIPNISVAGTWWHTFYPFYIRKSLETRLDMVPANKITGYFSDAYHAEWCYPKLKMVKQILGEILVERIERGWYDTDTAIGLIPRLFHDNPGRIYGV